VFRNAELSPDVLLASACLPTMFKAVEIEGEAYWDGGYSGNPTMTPLVQECVSDDTILVAINPVERPGIPRSAHDILNRVNEVSFNAVLLKELRMIALLRQVADAGNSECAHWAAMRIHMIGSQMLVDLGSSSKLNAGPCCATREDARRRASCRRMARLSGGAPRSTLIISCRVFDADVLPVFAAQHICMLPQSSCARGLEIADLFHRHQPERVSERKMRRGIAAERSQD
jgi:NTE family protein